MNRTAFSLPDHSEYRTRGGLAVTRNVEQFTGDAKRLDDLIDLLDRRRGVVLSSGTTVPGRYESFDLGFSDPPLWLQTTGSEFFAAGAERARRGADRLPGRRVARALRRHYQRKAPTRLAGHIVRGAAPVDEDQRTRRASVMSLVRDLVAALGANDDPLLGLFGAFAYDLVFQIEDLVQKRARENDQRDIVLFVPDRLLAYDRATGRGVVLSYDFAWNGKSTDGPAARNRRERLSPRRRGRDLPITRPANTRPRSRRRAPRLRAAICSRRCRGSCSPSPANARRRKCSSGCAGSIRRPMAR